MEMSEKIIGPAFKSLSITGFGLYFRLPNKYLYP